MRRRHDHQRFHVQAAPTSPSTGASLPTARCACWAVNSGAAWSITRTGHRSFITATAPQMRDHRHQIAQSPVGDSQSDHVSPVHLRN